MMCSYFAISKSIWTIYILGVLFWVKRVVSGFFFERGLWVFFFFFFLEFYKKKFHFICFWLKIWFEDHVFFKNILQERKRR
jgi:hypothetical protein